MKLSVLQIQARKAERVVFDWRVNLKLGYTDGL